MSVSASEYRSQSNISCDPYAQVDPSDSRAKKLRPCSSGLSTITTGAPFQNNGHGDAASPFILSSDDKSRRWKRRRLSWLQRSLSKASRAGKKASPTIIHPAPSMSSISNSSISSPQLTSTTNVRVANASNTDHTEFLFPVSSPSLFDPQHGAAHRSEETIGVHGIDNTSSWTLSVRGVRARVVHFRRASAGVILTAPWSKHKHGNEACDDTSSVFRFKSGTMARCREKFHYLGERLHVMPHGSGTSVVTHPEGVKAKEIQTQDVINESRSPLSRATSLLPKLHSDTNTNFRYSSLSRSFASAIGKLDLSSSPTLVNHSPDMGPLRRIKPETGLSTKYKDSENTTNKDSNKGKSLSQWYAFC